MSNSEVSEIINNLIKCGWVMDGEGSDKEKNLSRSEEKEDKEEPGEESAFFLIKKDLREVKEKENVREQRADKERNISAAFFIPGADTERLKEG